MQRALKKTAIQNPLMILGDGESAIAYLQRESPPEVAFLDVNLPLKSGLEILQWIRGQEKLKTLPAVVLISSETAEEGKIAIDNGATAVLSKPPTPGKLTALCEKLGIFSKS